jgi:hypothetical protein
VISSKGLRALEAAVRELDTAVEHTPELGGVREMLQQQMPALFPAGGISLAAAGLTADGGAAMFFSPSGARLWILPVTDRAKFLAFVNGTAADDGDQVGELTCKTVRDHYACAKPPGLLGRLGGGGLRDSVKLVGARGDVEVAIEDTNERGRLGAVAQLEHGTVVVRGALRTASVRGQLPNAAEQRFDATKLAGFGVLNVGPALSKEPVPAEPLAAGVTLADLVGNMTGPILLSLPPGIRQFDVRVPMKDPRIAQALVTHCEDIPYLAILSSRFSDGVCHLTVPGVSVDLDVSLEGSELRARATKPGATSTVALHPTPIASELSSGAWAYAVYGRGTVIGSFQQLVRSSVDVLFGIRLLSWLSEGGIGVRSEGDVLRFFAAVRTVWSYPDDVRTKWLALTAQELIDPATLETARTIAASAPSAPAADDVAAGTAVMVPMAALAMTAGLVVGARLDTQTMRNLGLGSSPNASAAVVLEKFATFKDAMCACRDAACAKRVSDEMTAWSMDQARRNGRPPQLSEAERARASALGEEMGTCLMRIGSAVGNLVDEYVAKNAEFRDRICACKDVACGEQASHELTTWSEAFVKTLPPGSRMSPVDDRKMEKIEQEVHACMEALRAGNK